MFTGKRPGWIVQKKFVWYFNDEVANFPMTIDFSTR
jgi:hypothetical protein